MAMSNTTADLGVVLLDKTVYNSLKSRLSFEYSGITYLPTYEEPNAGEWNYFCRISIIFAGQSQMNKWSDNQIITIVELMFNMLSHYILAKTSSQVLMMLDRS